MARSAAADPDFRPTLAARTPGRPGGGAPGAHPTQPRYRLPRPRLLTPVTVLLAALGLLAVVALTLGTAVAVASEFSLTALERSRVDRHAATVDDRRARAVARAHRTLSFQLSGCQLAITITTLVTGYIAEPAVASLIRPGLAAVGVPDRFVGGLATTLALVLATVLSMVFGELVPKNVAIADPLRTARAVVWIQAGFARALSRPIAVLNAAANALVRAVGVEPIEELRSARSPDELGSLVRASALRGTLDAATATLMDRSLRFTERVAEDLMTPRTRVTTLTLLPLPPYSPELNPVENVWQYLRQNQLSLRVWPDYEAIVDTCCRAWNALMAMPERLASITRREWAKAVRS